MSLKPYPAYKDSGVTWLGQIPAHWTVQRLKYLVEIKKRIAGEEGFDILSITQQGIKIKDTESNDGQLSMDYTKYQLVEVGDFAMNHMDLLTGYVDISKYLGVTSPDYRVFSVQDGDLCLPSFLLYLMQNTYKRKILYAFGQGASQLGRWRLPTDQFNDFTIPVPCLDEQQKIVAFIDTETAKIDELIAEQEKLIALLTEKRQATISYAVTKGLNPAAPMKDSGVEWLGQIPAHWEVGPVKIYCDVLDGKRIPLSAEQRGDMQGEYPYYGASGIIDYVNDYIFDVELVLVSEDGANLLMRNSRIAFVATGKYWVNNHAHILKPKDKLTFYWAERIEALDLESVVTGSAQPKLTIEALANLRVAIPPTHDERKEISAFIDNEARKLNALTTEASRVIDLLKERRIALISAAVTGKIDVRRPSAEIIDLAMVQRRVRGLLAVELIEKSQGRNTFGRTALQKQAYLAETFAGVHEISGVYARNAYGPLDSEMISEMEREAQTLCGIVTQPPSGTNRSVTYHLSQPAGSLSDELTQCLGPERSQKLQRLRTLLAPLDTHGAEGVATLFAVWNDFLIDGKNPNDDEIVNGFLNEWHPKKIENFNAQELRLRLGWMRRNGLVPTGMGPKTATGRLFV